METKKELTHRLTLLDSIQAKLQPINLTDDERDYLESLLQAQGERERSDWYTARATQAVALLFPVWRGGRIEPPTHPMWHQKSWWWNGAAIESLEGQRNGDIHVNLTSYVGGGSNDILKLTLKREWLEAEDMPKVIHAFMAQEALRLDTLRAAEEMANAKADLAAAQARMSRLQ